MILEVFDLLDFAHGNLQASHRDDKFGVVFDRVAQGSGMRVIKTAVRAPNMNAVMERFLRSVRTEVLDHVLVLDERRRERVLSEYVKFFNDARPHQGLGQRIPGSPGPKVRRERDRVPRAQWPSPRLSPSRVVPRFSTDQHGSQYGALVVEAHAGHTRRSRLSASFFGLPLGAFVLEPYDVSGSP